MLLVALFIVSFYGYAMENPKRSNPVLEVLVIKFQNYHHLIEGNHLIPGNENLYAASVEKDFVKLNDILREINIKNKERALTLNSRKQPVPKKMHPCPDCKKLFIYHHIFPHYRWHQKNTNFISCEPCQTAYETQRTFSEHLKTSSHKEKVKESSQ